jgi:hypothetical protein
MKLRGLLIGVALLAVLGGLAWWSERQQKAEEGKPPKDAPPKLVSIPDDQIQQVEIAKREGAPLTVKRGSSNRWEITSPSALPADQDAVSQMVGSLASLSADRVVEEKAGDLAAFGLAQPASVVTITKKDGKTEKLLLGDDTPLGNGAYAKLASDAKVVTIASYNKTALDKSITDLRDKKLLSFNTDKLTGVEITAKGQTMAFARNKESEWAVVKPAPARADNFQVEELVRKLKELQMQTGQEESKVAAEYAKAKPVLTAKVTDSSGVQQLDIRANSSQWFAKSSVRPAPAAIESAAAEALNKAPSEYRSKKLFEFGFNDPNKVEVRQAATNKSWLFTKGGEKWFTNGKEMDPTGIQAAISHIRDLAATGFADSGFKSADVEVVVTWNDGKRTDRVQFSKAPAGYIGRREGEPALYNLEPGPVDEIITSAGDVKEAQAAAAKDAKKK